MNIKNTTHVPNILFDIHLPHLKESELKILLVIIRQTLGWIDRYTGKRKIRDRITYGQFMKKTGLSRRVITDAIQSLVSLNLIRITNVANISLQEPYKRKGKNDLYYSAQLT